MSVNFKRRNAFFLRIYFILFSIEIFCSLATCHIKKLFV